MTTAEKKKVWYTKAFAEDYIWLYAHRSDREAAAQVRAAASILPFASGQRILDIACGTGRHMMAFARRGARVTGVDLSAPLLKIARGKFREAGLPARFRRCDMRELAYENSFDGVMMWFTSFGYFSRQADDRRALDCMARAVKPGGWWWVDLPNPAWLEANLVPHSESRRRGPNGTARVIEDRRINRGRVMKQIRIIDAAGERSYVESVRLYRPEQFGTLVKQSGLSADGILGNYDGSALRSDAPRQIWFGRRPR